MIWPLLVAIASETMSGILLCVAAALTVLIGLAHSYLGERYILTRLFRRPLPPLFGSDGFTRRTLRFAWHLTTVAWYGFAALLLLWARQGGRATELRIVALTFLVTALVTLISSRGRHLAWPVFLAIAILAWLTAGLAAG